MSSNSQKITELPGHLGASLKSISDAEQILGFDFPEGYKTLISEKESPEGSLASGNYVAFLSLVEMIALNQREDIKDAYDKMVIFCY